MTLRAVLAWPMAPRRFCSMLDQRSIRWDGSRPMCSWSEALPFSMCGRVGRPLRYLFSASLFSLFPRSEPFVAPTPLYAEFGVPRFVELCGASALWLYRGPIRRRGRGASRRASSHPFFARGPPSSCLLFSCCEFLRSSFCCVGLWRCFSATG